MQTNTRSPNDAMDAVTRAQRIAELRRKLRERTTARSERPRIEPRYDEVYFDGVAWLGTLAETDTWPESEDVDFGLSGSRED